MGIKDSALFKRWAKKAFDEIGEKSLRALTTAVPASHQRQL